MRRIFAVQSNAKSSIFWNFRNIAIKICAKSPFLPIDFVIDTYCGNSKRHFFSRQQSKTRNLQKWHNLNILELLYYQVTKLSNFRPHLFRGSVFRLSRSLTNPNGGWCGEYQNRLSIDQLTQITTSADILTSSAIVFHHRWFCETKAWISNVLQTTNLKVWHIWGRHELDDQTDFRDTSQSFVSKRSSCDTSVLCFQVPISEYSFSRLPATQTVLNPTSQNRFCSRKPY